MTASAKKVETATPMMAQYLNIKQDYSDCLLFYRMGDFYEMFFDDSLIAAKTLNIALTKRGKHNGEDIPMCGVPFHACDNYLNRLINAGFKVAICEQMESPEQAKKRGYKAIVRREVVRVITPGTIIEEALLDARKSNYLAAVSSIGGKLALAWIDMSTGEFRTCPTTKEALNSDLARLNAKELLLPDKMFIDAELSPILREHKAALSPQVASMFEFSKTDKKIKEFFGVASLDGFGNFSRAEISACGSLIEYFELTQKGNMPRLEAPKNFNASNFMNIDAATRRNLEITSTMSGEKKGSLLSIIDKTITSSASRMMYANMASPLCHPNVINNRLDGVQFFCDNEHVRSDVREILKRIADIERSLSRICIDKGGPKDLLAIRDGLTESTLIAEILEFSGVELPSIIAGYLRDFGSHDQIINKLKEALNDEVGVLARDGGFVATGYHNGLDEYRELRDNGRNKIIELRDKYRQETGINTLKITQNNVLGYFVEVSPNNSDKIVDEKFVHRQTLASAVRYTTQDLRQLENDISEAKNNSQKLEIMIFDELVLNIKQLADKIYLASQSIAFIDFLAALAQIAIENNYTRPHIDDSLQFDIQGGRHPVVEANISESEFIKNNCNLSHDERLWLLTGPNMAGKSTFLRQNAIIAIMAQIGSFVPADSACIGVVDKLFSRVGASDDLARGRSTFMVEMVETAAILNQSTKRSLVILDEIGRGTATYDGLSIAWSVVEYLHGTNKCRSLFATHYHELTSLKSSLKSLSCYTMKVKEWEGDVIFMHEVIKGAADRSYGIHVAKLAGLPNRVTKRANEILCTLQENDTTGTTLKLSNDLPLFAALANDDEQANASIALATEPSQIELSVAEADIDNMSPRDALEFVYKLKEQL